MQVLHDKSLVGLGPSLEYSSIPEEVSHGLKPKVIIGKVAEIHGKQMFLILQGAELKSFH